MPNFYELYTSGGICKRLLEHTSKPTTLFYKYHFDFPRAVYAARSDWPKFESRIPKIKDLADFLKATSDEVRLMKADDFSISILTIPDLRDAAYFRNAIMRKELSADLDYKKQRDHAAHTLYNYLVGWYIYENSTAIRTALNQQIERKIFRLKYTDKIDKTVYAFGIIWTYASLLHDIGYLLEGSLSNLSLEVEVTHVSKGAAIIHDYFNHFFWRHIDLDYRAARDIIKRLNLYVPDFKSIRSIAALSDNLCVLGDCEPIRTVLKEEFLEMVEHDVENPCYGGLKHDLGPKFAKNEFNSICNNESFLDIDSFKLWELHYKFFHNYEAAKLFKQITEIYHNLVWEGHPTYNARTINHGTASGLLSLMFSTFFYQIYFGLNSVNTIKSKLKNDGKTGFVDKLTVIYQSGAEDTLTPDQIRQIRSLVEPLYLIIRTGFGYGLLPNNSKLLDILSSLESSLHSFELKPSSEDQMRGFILDKLFRLIKLISEDLKWLDTQYNFSSVYDFITKECIDEHFEYNGSNWFSLVLWGTAAAAMHDIVQNKDLWKYPEQKQYYDEIIANRPGNQGLLQLGEMPLCYLGILVDIIQEWDRYSVIKDSIFSEKFQLQGTQVDIEHDTDSKIILSILDNKEVEEKIISALDFCLNKWRDYLTIQPIESP